MEKKHRPRIPAVSAALSAVIFTLFIGGGLGHSPGGLSVYGNGASPLFPQTKKAAEISLRNATAAPREYRIRPHRGKDPAETRILEPGEIHKYPTDDSLDISFQRNAGRTTYRLDPGHHYVFRFDPTGELELYEGSHNRSDAVDLAPYVQTPMPVVLKMLELAEVRQDDLVIDIGCGDGRIIIAAAERFGARGIGIDIVPERIREAEAGARAAGVDELVEFRLEDATKSDYSRATVVTLYLIPDSNALLRPILERQLKPGTRVVSHGYPISGWDHKFIREAEVPSDYEGTYYIYLYKK